MFFTAAATAAATASAAVFPVGRNVLDDDLRMKSSAGSKVGGYAQKAWFQNARKIVENLIRQPFVKDALVAVRLEIELQALELDAELVRDIFERDRAVVRLTRLRTEGRKLRTYVRYEIIAARIRVVEAFQNFGRRFLGNDVWHFSTLSV